MSSRVLVVDDDPQVAKMLMGVLVSDGYDGRTAKDAESAMSNLRAWRPALIITDLEMPQVDGIELCRRVRHTSSIPIIVLSSSADRRSEIAALDSGADDYLARPLSTDTLLARVRVALRRSREVPEAAFGVGQFHIDFDDHRVRVNGQPVRLTPKEFDLFWELLDHSGLVLTRDQLLERVWGYTFAGDTRTVDVHVRQLRRKIGETCPIVTVWGVGYKVADDASAVS